MRAVDRRFHEVPDDEAPHLMVPARISTPVHPPQVFVGLLVQALTERRQATRILPERQHRGGSDWQAGPFDSLGELFDYASLPTKCCKDCLGRPSGGL
jgi:hypothetical protein